MFEFITPDHFVAASNFLLGSLGLIVSVYLAPQIWKFVKYEYTQVGLKGFFTQMIAADFIRTLTGMFIVFLSFTVRVTPYMPWRAMKIAGNDTLAEWYLGQAWIWQLGADILMPLGTFMIMYPVMADLKRAFLDKVWAGRPMFMNRDAGPFVHFISVCVFCWIITALLLVMGLFVVEGVSWLF